mgnify:CR=1 FL=1
MKFKKIDKDELVDNVVVGGVLAWDWYLSIPFVMLADGVKKIYNRIPAVARKRERLNARFVNWSRFSGLKAVMKPACSMILISTEIFHATDFIIIMR